MLGKEDDVEVEVVNNSYVEIDIKYHDSTLTKIEKFKIGDWVDLRTAEPIKMGPFEYKLISLGVSMVLPEGHEALIVPRSSTFKKYKVIQANSMGVIDESYKGDDDIWRFPALTLTQATEIPANSRICQFRIMAKQPTNLKFVEKDMLGNPNRGGFGGGTGHE